MWLLILFHADSMHGLHKTTMEALCVMLAASILKRLNFMPVFMCTFYASFMMPIKLSFLAGGWSSSLENLQNTKQFYDALMEFAKKPHAGANAITVSISKLYQFDNSHKKCPIIMIFSGIIKLT